MRGRSPTAKFCLCLCLCLVIFSLQPLSLRARPFVLVLSQEDFKDAPADDSSADPDSPADWDDFGDSDAHKSEHELDPDSWRPIFEPDSISTAHSPSESETLYYSGVSKMMSAVSSADVRLMEEAAGEIEAAAESGYPGAQSVLGFLSGMGLLRERSKSKAFLYHHFAAEGGNMQSKMALAYTYTRQDVSPSFTFFPFQFLFMLISQLFFQFWLKIVMF